MNNLGFYALSALWLFALFAPLTVFYFLKLKRPRQAVPSLTLWRQVMNDQRVNSPFQRFKRNLLLILQAAALLAAILAALQPFWRGKVARVQRLPVLVDCSASMAALDKPGGISRLDAAKDRVRVYIDRLLPDQELCLIAFSRAARKLTGFTNNKRILRDALDALQAEDVPSDVEEALRLTQALARSDPFDEVLLISDGNFPPQAQFALSFTLNYQKLDAGGANLGLTALNARRAENGMWDIFVGVEGSDAADGAATVELTQNDQVVKTETIAHTKGRAERLIFQVPGQQPSAIRVRVLPDGFDALASDNVAYLELPALRSLWVYCPTSLATWRRALSTLPDVTLFPEEGSASPESGYDLVVTDKAEDLALRARTVLTVGYVPPDLQKLVTVDKEGTNVVDWQRNAPVLQHVELADLLLLEQPSSNDGVRDGDYDNLGCEILIHGRRGPLMIERREPEKTTFHLLFHSDRSTLPYRVGFPILVSNLVRIALQTSGLSEIQSTRTGILTVQAQPERNYKVTGPEGAEREATSDKGGVLGGIPATQVGLYAVREGTADRMRIGASLLSPTETTLRSTERLQFNEELHVTASTAPVRTDKSLWSWFALAGFLVLLVEWWLFCRRPGGQAR